MQILFHRLAVAEFIAARRWHSRRGPTTETRFVAAVDEALRRIEANPQIGNITSDIFRCVRVRKYSYLVHYAVIDPVTLQVYAIGHAHRRPAYWMGRVRRP